jgi:hypothetical protein
VGAAFVGLAFPEMLPAALFCVSDCEFCPGLLDEGDVCCGSGAWAKATVVASTSKGSARKMRFIEPSCQISGQSLS